jgi:membrane protein DedA with SNARE-associated domain
LDSVVNALAGFITATISVLGYPGVVLLMALESACLPVPSEIVMPFSGYLASTGRFDLLLVVTAGAVGCNIGSTVAYLIGATGGRRLVEKWGRYIFLTKGELDRMEGYFARYGSATIFLARVLPMIPAFISFPAGIARMPFWKFQLYTFAGTWLWCGALALAGLELGKAWASSPALNHALHAFDWVVVVAAIAAVAWFTRRFWKKNRDGS